MAVTQNAREKSDRLLQKAYADSVRENMAAGINGRRTISRDVPTGCGRSLGNRFDSGIIDAAGRWRPDKYVEMLRTKMMNTYRSDDDIRTGARCAVCNSLSRHGATDSCSNWEGKSLSFSVENSGPYPTYDQLRNQRDIIRIASTLYAYPKR
ncbi:hypothetical protein P7H12_10585 [Paenibacillus larvae]|nr:hypothetical protein [Paenibacillus larvae]MDT2263950.1 hypothetical protein [Paenibacillus larvae]